VCWQQRVRGAGEGSGGKAGTSSCLHTLSLPSLGDATSTHSFTKKSLDFVWLVIYGHHCTNTSSLNGFPRSKNCKMKKVWLFRITKFSVNRKFSADTHFFHTLKNNFGGFFWESAENLRLFILLGYETSALFLFCVFLLLFFKLGYLIGTYNEGSYLIA